MPETADEIEHIDLPGEDETLQEQRDSVRAAHDYLEAVETATPANFEEEVHPDYEASSYIDDDADEWWETVAAPGLRQLSDVEPPRGDDGEWTYDPEPASAE